MNSLFLIMGAPALPPNWFWWKGNFLAFCTGSHAVASSALYRRIIAATAAAMSRKFMVFRRSVKWITGLDQGQFQGMRAGRVDADPVRRGVTFLDPPAQAFWTRPHRPSGPARTGFLNPPHGPSPQRHARRVTSTVTSIVLLGAPW